MKIPLSAAWICLLPLVAHGQVVVQKTSGEIPLEPGHSAWAAAAPAPLFLSPQLIALPHGGEMRHAELRALHNGREIAFALSWADSTADGAREIARFQDMAAVMFPSAGKDYNRVSPFMGDAENTAAVWLWRADYAADLDGSGDERLNEHYPAYADFYNENNEATVHRFRTDARKARVPSPIEALVAAGFGRIGPDKDESVRGSATREDGRVTVVFARALKPSGKAGAAFTPGVATGVNVAVWDGDAENRGSRKSVGMGWTRVEWK